jgi:hypothetical protein
MKPGTYYSGFFIEKVNDLFEGERALSIATVVKIKLMQP